MNLIIFDLDGTLVDLPIDYPKLKRELAQKFKNELALESLYKFLVSLDPQSLREAFRIIDKYELDSIEHMKVDETIHKAFRLTKNIRKALVTLQGEKPAKAILERIGILHEFDLIVTREFSLSREKQLEYVVKYFEVKKEKVVFIGNTQNDLEAAKKVGINVIIKGWECDGKIISSIADAVKYALELLKKH